MEIGPRTLRSTLSYAVAPPVTTTYGGRRAFNAAVLGFADLLSLSLSAFFAAAVLQMVTGYYSFPVWCFFLLPAWYCGASLLHLLPGWGLGPVEELRRLTILLFLIYFATAAATAFGRQISNQNGVDIGYAEMAISFLASAGAVPLARRRAKMFLLLRNYWGLPAVVYGEGEGVSQIVDILNRERGLGYTPVGVFDDSRRRGTQCRNVPVMGGTMMMDVTPAPVAIVNMPSMGRERTVELLEGPLSRFRTVIVIPDLIDAPSLWVKPRDLNGLLGLEIRCNLCSPVAQVLKRTFDVVAVILTMPVWVPLCTLIAALIWVEDRAHPFFFQARVGQNGRTFDTCKFRTMYLDAEQVLQDALEKDPEMRRKWTLNFKLEHDPRVTRIGRLLRRYSLDELPQLVNVIRGEMSLVGPRPLPVYHHRALRARVQGLRERVKPGLTGLWQVSGRSDSGSDGMELYDPYYVRNWSLWLDAIILFRTFGAVTSASGAY